MIVRLIKWIFGKKDHNYFTIPETLERKPEIIEETILVLKSLLNEGNEIRAEWDAGGDDTCCDVFISGESSYQHKNYDVCEVVRIRIIDLLNLPNVGEKYHKGRG